MMLTKLGISNMLIFFMLLSPSLKAQQDDLMSMLDSMVEPKTNYAEATFKSSRIINGHSVERVQSKQLHFRISHRFGQVNLGWRELWGIDRAIMYMSFEYGISDKLMVGLGRTIELKTYHGFYKYTIARQSSGARNMPVSISLHSSISVNSVKWNNPQKDEDFNGRISYTHQLPVARKMNENLSLQITPSYVHRNLVDNPALPNDLYVVGLGGRYKLTKWVSVNAEYFYVIPPFDEEKEFNNRNNLSFGFDIETGGHVFQLHITNSRSMIEPYFIGNTTDKWLDGGIYFGFNLLRVFALGGN